MPWRGIVGKSFTPDAFEKYIGTLKFGVWRPRFIVVHNTSAPDTKTWQGWQSRKPPVTDEKWAQNLVGYYRDQEGWSAGPHLFVTPKGILVFSPLTGPGTHSPAWNSVTWGVETVGEFERDPFTGPIRDNLVAALAILHAAAGLQPLPYERGVRGMHFHKEDPKTTHKSCPGRNMMKADLVAAVQAEIERRHAGGGHAHTFMSQPSPGEFSVGDGASDNAAPSAPQAYPQAPSGPDGVLIIETKKKLDEIGYHEFGILNADWGGRTVAAIAAYKLDRGMTGPAEIDDALTAQLNTDIANKWRRPMKDERTNATVSDLAPHNETIKQNWWTRLWSKMVAIPAGIGAAVSGIMEKFPDAKANYIDPVMGFFSDVPGWLWFVGAAGVAAAVWIGTRKSDSTVVQQFQDGRLLR